MKLLKQLAKDFFSHACVQRVLGLFIALYVRLVFKTSRWKSVGFAHIKPYLEGKKPVITCFWHGRMMMMVYAWPSKKPFFMLQTAHRDGRLMHAFLKQFNLGGVLHQRGDAGKAVGLIEMRRALQQGYAVGFTPDGPKGPKHKMKKGLPHLAIKEGCDVVPVAFSSSRHYIARSWDQFFVARPFSKGVFVYGKPLNARMFKGNFSAFQNALERSLVHVTEEADRYCGCG